MPDDAKPAPAPARRTPLSPKKLLLSKWTAVQPRNREKHFVVVRVIEPDPPAVRIERIELEAVHSGRGKPARPWKSQRWVGCPGSTIIA